MLLLVFVTRLSRTATDGIAAILQASMIADLAFAQKSAAGALRGDWGFRMAFAAVPSITMAYALIRLGAGRRAPGSRQVPASS